MNARSGIWRLASRRSEFRVRRGAFMVSFIGSRGVGLDSGNPGWRGPRVPRKARWLVDSRTCQGDQTSLASQLLSRHSWVMPANAFSVSVAEPADLGRGLTTRLARYFKAQVEDWYDVCRQLGAWEERHLIDQPTPERLAEHARVLDELEHAGRWLARATQTPDFPDRATAELVALTMQDLQDRRALWHGPMKPEQREAVLREIFHEP